MESGQDCAIETRSDLDQNKTDFFFPVSEALRPGSQFFVKMPLFCSNKHSGVFHSEWLSIPNARGPQLL